MAHIIWKLTFYYYTEAKKIFWCYRWQLRPHLSPLFLNQFLKFWCLSDSKFPEFFNTHQNFVFRYSRSRQNSKKQSGPNDMGHPVQCTKVD